MSRHNGCRPRRRVRFSKSAQKKSENVINSMLRDFLVVGPNTRKLFK